MRRYRWFLAGKHVPYRVLFLRAFFFGCLCAVFALSPTQACAQDAGVADPVENTESSNEEDGVEEDKVEEDGDGEEESTTDWLVLPFLSYAPETHLAFGALGTYLFRFDGEKPESRASSVTLLGRYTTRGQSTFELIPEFYADGGSTHSYTKFDYRSYPDSFWGIGNQTPDDAEERWHERAFGMATWLRRRIYEELFIGGRYDVRHLDVEDTVPGGLFDNSNLVGHDGGWTSGLGVTLGWDDRDNTFAATKGGLYQIEFMVWHKAILSEYNFAKLTTDVRKYLTLTGQDVLAMRFYSELLTGDVPFHYMGQLGGDKLMRGYFEGRFRDKSLWALQLEYRSPRIWRFSGVLFASTGAVAPSLDTFNVKYLRVAGGGGLRFLLTDEGINVRVDLGVSPEGIGFYVNAAEAF